MINKNSFAIKAFSLALSVIILMASFTSVMVFASTSDATLKEINTSTPYAIELAEGKTSYTLYVPYNYDNGNFNEFDVPVVEAVPSDPDAEVEVIYPDDITGDIVINVTSADDIATYTLDLVPIGKNLYANGNFENGLANWSKMGASTIIEETENVYTGSGAMRLERSGFGYVLNSPLPTLKNSVKYLHSNAIMLAEDATVSESTMDPFLDGSLKESAGTTSKRYDEEGPVDAFSKIKKEWCRQFLTIVPGSDATANLFHICSWAGEQPVILDDMYLGELVISDVIYSGETELEIPFEDGTENEYDLSAELVNQFGLSQGLEDEELIYSLKDDYNGISLDGNILTVSDIAEKGEINVNITVEPSFSSAYGNIKKTVTLSVDGDWEDKELPRAKNLEITGEVTDKSKISIKYDFYQLEGKEEGTSLYQWYYADSEDGDYIAIEEETNRDYFVDSFHETKFIRATVTPVAEDGTDGKTQWTNILVKPQAPVANDVSIKGKGFVDEVWEGTYEFFDVNGNEEALEGEEGKVTSFRWLIGDSEAGPFKPIENETSKYYTVKEEDIDKYIVFEVVPKATVEPIGTLAYTSKPKLAATRAVAKDVKIKKNSGKIFSVTYTVVHPDEEVFEKDSIITWYMDSEKIGEGARVSIENKSGKKLEVEVLPRVNKKPYDGVPAYSTYKIDSSRTETTVSNGGSYQRPVVTPPVETPPVVTPELPTDTHWAAEAVKFNREKDIMPGLTNGMPEYNKPLTRAEFLVYVMKAIGETQAEYKGMFADITEETCYRGYVQRAVDLGIISPYDKFYPERNLTREEASKIVALALGIKESTLENLDKFSDKGDLSEWAKVYVSIVEKEGILKGVSETEFNGKGTITLAQGATITKRLYERKAGEAQ